MATTTPAESVTLEAIRDMRAKIGELRARADKMEETLEMMRTAYAASLGETPIADIVGFPDNEPIRESPQRAGARAHVGYIYGDD